MLFQSCSLTALSALFLLSFTATSSAGHARIHRHYPRAAHRHGRFIWEREPHGDGTVEIPTSDLELLRTEMTAFQGWMKSWIGSANATDPATSVAQLRQEFQAFDGWMTAWLESTLSPGVPAPSKLPSSVPITTSTAAFTASPVASTSPIIVEVTESSIFTQPMASSSSPSSSPLSSPSSPPTAAQLVSPPLRENFQESPNDSPKPTTLISVPSTPSTAPSPPSSTTPSSSDTLPAGAHPYAQPLPQKSSPSPNSGSSNVGSSNSLAVYYGQSAATSQVTLAQMCADPSVDIVVLAFLTTYFGPGGYPTLNLGAACGGGPSVKMASVGASGLLQCPALSADIKTCQSSGKKILLSLGGAESTTAFSSAAEAQGFAAKLWDLFGGGGQGGDNSGLRPFGDAIIDGFDVDNEDHSTAFYSAFVSALRQKMNSDTSRKYYISAAPQCPRPDASIPLDAMQQMDFVFVQFYNNGDCNVGQPGFEASLKAWSGDLAAKGAGPKLFIGAPGCQECAGSG
ncbi:MAG: hypothetical protein Q9214_000870, partial [Letrouitia sp. 1 TL-2023]